MTKQQHPITPPPELVEQWATEYYGQPVRLPNRHSGKYIATKAADWQLEQVIEWISENLGVIDDLPDAGMIPRYLKNTCDDECAVVDEWKVISDLKKAMRPAKQEDNQ